jgi:hypothetical protein
MFVVFAVSANCVFPEVTNATRVANGSMMFPRVAPKVTVVVNGVTARPSDVNVASKAVFDSLEVVKFTAALLFE